VDIEWGNRDRDTVRGSMSSHPNSRCENSVLLFDLKLLTFVLRRPGSARLGSNIGVDESVPVGSKAIYYHKHKGHIQQLKIHYEKYSSKWDEIFPPDSSNIAPLGSHTTPSAAIPPLPQGVERAIGWLQSHGVLGKYEAAVDMSPRDRAETVGAYEDTIMHDQTLVGMDDDALCGCFGRREGKRKDSFVPTSVISVHARRDDGSNTVFSTPQKSGQRPSSHRSPFKASEQEAGEKKPKLATPAKDMARAIFASMGLSPHRSPYGNMYERRQYRNDRDGDVELRSGREDGDGSAEVSKRRSVKKGDHSGTNSTAIPGVCGLLNIGNTCFMSCGLQCLSHTPLFRSYFLSGRYVEEINRDNPLGTGGKLIGEFAQLLKLIWSGNSVHVSPAKFKRVRKYNTLHCMF
jgi:hypothetical protein